jgi:hypothetical protein
LKHWIFDKMTQQMDRTTPDSKASTEELDHPKIYAARMRLQNSLDQADALEAIREIVANLLGSEEMALFRIDVKNAALWLYWSFGIDPNRFVVMDTIHDVQLERALAGETVVLDPDERLKNIDDHVTALVPVLIDGVTAAVLVIFRLFTHKRGIDATDREILSVLSNCSGRAVGYKA